MESLEFKTKAELIYEKLRADILKGNIKPGEPLNYDALARELNVSKIPIREAVKRLEIEWLAVQMPHSGARVAPLSFHEMRGFFMLREALEGMATRVATSTITGEELRRLHGVHRKMGEQVQQNRLEPLSSLNHQFHILIAQATRFMAIAETTERVLRKMTHFRVATSRYIPNWVQILEEHQAILTALESRYPPAAEQAAHHHVQSQLQSYAAAVAQFDLSFFIDSPPDFDDGATLEHETSP